MYVNVLVPAQTKVETTWKNHGPSTSSPRLRWWAACAIACAGRAQAPLCKNRGLGWCKARQTACHPSGLREPKVPGAKLDQWHRIGVARKVGLCWIHRWGHWKQRNGPEGHSVNALQHVPNCNASFPWIAQWSNSSHSHRHETFEKEADQLIWMALVWRDCHWMPLPLSGIKALQGSGGTKKERMKEHQKRSNSVWHPSKMESWVQSWRPRTNAFCDFSTPPV